MTSVCRIRAKQTDVVCQVNLGIVVNVTKDLQAKTAKVALIIPLPLKFLLTSINLAQIVSSGCLSNPCTIGICYQLNRNGQAYVCICPDGTLSLSCTSTSKFCFFFYLLQSYRNDITDTTQTPSVVSTPPVQPTTTPVSTLLFLSLIHI